MNRRVARTGAGLVLALALTACTLPFGAGPQSQTVQAVLPRANNLFEGSDVRVLGIRVGSVRSLEPEGLHVLATMEIDQDIQLPADVNAVLTPTSLLGERFIQLDPPYTGGPTLQSGSVIPPERTRVPAEIDEVLASFEAFLEGLDRDTLSNLVDVLAETLAGQGEGLNRLLDQGSTTVRILADSSDDLNGIVSEMADFNETLATRERQIGTFLEDWSTVVRTISEESDQIVDGLANLRRLMNEIRPLTDEHADQIVADMEVLATSLSTVERNLDRLGLMIRGSRLLFEGAGRGINFEHARLRLDNEGEPLAGAITLRLVDRLVGLCLRLGVELCSVPEFWEPHLPDLICIPGLSVCPAGGAQLSAVLAEALGQLPPEALEELVTELEEAEAEGELEPAPAEPEPTEPAGSEPPPAVPQPEPTEDSLLDRLPLPDPRLQDAGTTEESLLDRLARMLGGGR
jgi:phospholipid/cholesterol/gamma-HCH transport system substrate-binding protein